MIANVFHEESVATRMLDMVARCAPKLMRAGGGALSKECARRFRTAGPTFWDNPKPLKPEKLAKIIALARAGKTCEAEICRITGATQSVINKLIHAQGIKVPAARRGAREAKEGGK